MSLSSSGNECVEQRAGDKPNAAIFSEVLINSSVDLVWPELVNYFHWYVNTNGGGPITRTLGHPAQVGYTLEINNRSRHEVISVNPMSHMVWKICLIASCEDDFVFGTMSLSPEGGKVRLSINSVSQGFWTDDYLKQLRLAQSQGASSTDADKKVLLRFKSYVESKTNY